MLNTSYCVPGKLRTQMSQEIIYNLELLILLVEDILTDYFKFYADFLWPYG